MDCSTEAIRIYLAGPFFNDEQIKLIDRLENVLGKIGLLYSPRQYGVLEKDGDLSPQDIFQSNVAAIRNSDIIIAQIAALDDRPALIHLNRLSSIRIQEEIDSFMKELPNYTDVGTVWEMGMGYSLGIPIIGVNVGFRRINVMLAGCCSYIVNIDNFYNENSLKRELVDKCTRALKGEREQWKNQNVF